MEDESTSSDDSVSDEPSEEGQLSPLRSAEAPRAATGPGVCFVSRRFSSMAIPPLPTPAPAPAIETHVLDVESPSAVIEREKEGGGLLYFPPENVAEYLHAGLVQPVSVGRYSTAPRKNVQGNNDSSSETDTDRSGVSMGELSPECAVFYCAFCMRTCSASRRQKFEGNGGCTHEFCTDCLDDYLFQRIRVGHHSFHPCPKSGEQGCQASASNEDVERIVCPDVFEEHRRRLMGMSGPCEVCGSRVRLVSKPEPPVPCSDLKDVCHSCGIPVTLRGAWLGSPFSRSAIGSPTRSDLSESPTMQSMGIIGRWCCWWRNRSAETYQMDAPASRSNFAAFFTLGGRVRHGEPEDGEVMEDDRSTIGTVSRHELSRPCPGCDSGVLKRARSSEAQNLTKCETCGDLWCWICLQLISCCCERPEDNPHGGEGCRRDIPPHEHYSWWNIPGCPGARLTNPKVWDGEYLSLYRVFVAILVFLIGPVFIILRGTVLVIGHYASPLGFFSCGNWRLLPDVICFFIAVPLALIISVAWLPLGFVATIVASVTGASCRGRGEGRRRTLVFAPAVMLTSYLMVWWKAGSRPRTQGRLGSSEGKVSHSGEWELAGENDFKSGGDGRALHPGARGSTAIREA